MYNEQVKIKESVIRVTITILTNNRRSKYQPITVYLDTLQEKKIMLCFLMN